MENQKLFTKVYEGSVEEESEVINFTIGGFVEIFGETGGAHIRVDMNMDKVFREDEIDPEEWEEIMEEVCDNVKDILGIELKPVKSTPIED